MSTRKKTKKLYGKKHFRETHPSQKELELEQYKMEDELQNSEQRSEKW